MIRGLLALLAIAFIGQAQAADLPSSKWSPERAFKARVSAALNMRAYIQKVQLSTMGAGGKGTHAATFTGPGDLNAYVEAYGTVAYSSATRGQKLVNACLHSTPASCADAFSDAVTGILVLPSPGATLCSTVGGANQCDIHIAYSLTGSGHDATDQGVTAARPPLDPTGLNGHPAIKCTGSSNLNSTTIAFTSWPLSMMEAGRQTASSGGFDTPFDSNNGDVAIFYDPGGTAIEMNAAGTSGAATSVLNTTYSIVGTNDGTNTTIQLNTGSQISQVTGTTQISANIGLCNGQNGSVPWTGEIGFLGYAGTAFSNANAISAMNHVFWNN